MRPVFMNRFIRSVVISGLAVIIVATNVRAQRVVTSDIWTHLPSARAYLEDAAREQGFSGVVLIGRGDTVVLEEAWGFAEAEHQVPLRTDHRFRIGSLTKPITASAVLAAVDDGRLSLDMLACPLLPSCPRTWQEVRLRHLLTHSSGIPDYFGELEAVPVEKTLEELERVLIALPADDSLRSTPGAEYAYSNFGYVLLGAILEKTLGSPWETVLRDLVFDPLELTTMAYDDVFAIVPHRARGYLRDDDAVLRNIEYDDHAAYAAGGLLSTARDLFRWTRGTLKGRLFSSVLVDEAVTPYRGDYGFGWQVRRFFDRPIYNHTGGIDGFSSHLAHFPAEDLTIVVLSNIETDAAILRTCDIAALLFVWHAADSPRSEMTPRQRCGVE